MEGLNLHKWCAVAQVLVRWALQHGTVVIPKASSESHLRSNLEALDWELPQEEYKELSSLKFQVGVRTLHGCLVQCNTSHVVVDAVMRLSDLGGFLGMGCAFRGTPVSADLAKERLFSDCCSVCCHLRSHVACRRAWWTAACG